MLNKVMIMIILFITLPKNKQFIIVKTYFIRTNDSGIVVGKKFVFVYSIST